MLIIIIVIVIIIIIIGIIFIRYSKRLKTSNKFSILENKEFIEDGFVHLSNFIAKDDFEILKKITMDNKDNSKYISEDYNNPYIENKKRKKIVAFYDTKNNDLDYVYGRNPEYTKIIDKILFNLEIDKTNLIFIYLLVIKPGAPEQEVHFDGLKELPNKDMTGYIKQMFIGIPLHYTPIEQGTTILYSNKINKELDDEYLITRNKGYFNDFSPELQEIYKKYRNQKEHQERDLIVWDNYTQHSGGENKSSQNRYFILISLKKN